MTDDFVRRLVDQVRDYAIFGIDLDGRITTWNLGALNVLGYAEDEFIGLDASLLFVPEDRAAGIPERELAEAAAKGSSSNDRWMLRKDGRRFWAGGRTSSIRDAAGELVGYGKVMRDRSDLKQVTTDLRVTSDRYQTLVETASDAILTIDTDSIILFANPAVERIFGYSPDELIGRSLTRLMPEALRDRHSGGLERYLVTGTRRLDWRRAELPGCHRDGHEISLEVAFGESTEGSERTFTGIIRDVTERQAAERALQRSEARSRALIEQSPLPTLVFDLAGHPVAANPAWERKWGVTLADARAGYTLLGDAQLEAQGYRPLVARALAGEAVTLPSVHYDIARETDGRGHTFWIQGHFYPIRDPAGALLEIVLVQIDITELHQAQLALRDSEARFRAALEAVTDMLWTNDASGRMTGEQPQWAAFTGQTYEQYQGYGWADAVHPDDAQPTLDAWHEAVRTRSVLTFEHRVRRHDGVYRRFALRAVPVLDEQGDVREWVAVHSDITDRVRVEERLRQAERLQAVGTLAGGVAHEVNNQMTAILGFGQFVLDGIGPDHPQAPDVTDMLRSAQRAARITQQLLAFSRRQVTQPQLLDPHRLAIELENVLGRILGSDKSLVIPAPNSRRRILADRTQIEQVLINLVANARDAMRTGGTVTITFDEVELDAAFGQAHDVIVTPGTFVRMVVADDGAGMDRETLRRIFEPFFTTKVFGEGTGLGLSTVYGIVKQHDGFIWGYSEVGKGTAMKVYLPAATETDEADKADEAAGARHERRRSPRSGLTVLVVEDEAAVRAMARRSLEAAGYAVIEASDGHHARALMTADRGTIALVLTDVVMAGMNGGELGEALRDSHPAVPVIYMSGYPGEEIRRRGLVPGEAAFLAKPFSPSEVVAKVRGVLGRGAGGGGGDLR
ncbi:MAG TPA: PAS domain S-box protein [Gemmatimonadales bacterium]|nr:PAS domain S-box protein [Gemmatimonadales bacterium]